MATLMRHRVPASSRPPTGCPLAGTSVASLGTIGSTARTPKPPSASGTGRERATVDLDPLPHADQAVTGARRRQRGGRAPPVVGDLDRQLVGLVGDAHRGRRRRAGVLEHVGERLLDDAVDGQLDPRGERSLVDPRSPARSATPLADDCATTAAMSAIPGCGDSAAPWSPVSRSTPSMRRSSASDSRPTASIVANTSAALSGSACTISRPAAACTEMTLIECATTSCISRAIRLRSLATARSAAARRSASAAAARRSVSTKIRSRLRMITPAVIAAAEEGDHAQRGERVEAVVGVEEAHARREPAARHRTRPSPTTPAGGGPRGRRPHTAPAGRAPTGTLRSHAGTSRRARR